MNVLIQFSCMISPTHAFFTIVICNTAFACSLLAKSVITSVCVAVPDSFQQSADAYLTLLLHVISTCATLSKSSFISDTDHSLNFEILCFWHGTNHDWLNSQSFIKPVFAVESLIAKVLHISTEFFKMFKN